MRSVSPPVVRFATSPRRTTDVMKGVGRRGVTVKAAGVRFHHKVNIREFMNHRKWSRELKKQCWYSATDFKQMKDAGIELIKASGANWEELLALGLEAPERYRDRRTAILNAKHCVLMEQDRYRHAGCEPDPYEISHKSQWVTQSSRIEAIRRASIIASQIHDKRSLLCYQSENRAQDGSRHLLRSYSSLGAKSMSWDEIEMSFEPPPSNTRSKPMLQNTDIYPINVGMLELEDPEERQTMETTMSERCQWQQTQWHPVSVLGTDGLSDSFSHATEEESKYRPGYQRW